PAQSPCALCEAVGIVLSVATRLLHDLQGQGGTGGLMSSCPNRPIEAVVNGHEQWVVRLILRLVERQRHLPLRELAGHASRSGCGAVPQGQCRSLRRLGGATCQSVQLTATRNRES